MDVLKPRNYLEGPSTCDTLSKAAHPTYLHAVKQPLGQARINVSVVPNTSHGPVMPRIRPVTSGYL